MDVAEVFGDLPSLETERLLLRRATARDVPDVFAYASDPEVARHTTWAPHRTPEDSRAFVDTLVQQYAVGEVSNWVLVHRSEGRVVGTCGFVYWLPRHDRAEVGYALARRLWRRGLMTEAVRAVIAFGFETMRCNRIEARCLPENTGSARVMEKVGMRLEGVLREHMYVKGAYRSLRMYSILRGEWRP